MSVNASLKTPLIALVGPPNSGKTTLFNALSGQNYKTVNYPGATVEYSFGKILSRFNLEAQIIDSPGIISLVPNSPDEKVAVDALYSIPNYGTPDIVIATVDASQLSRHLFLVKQLLLSNFRVVIALTMTDILQKKGLHISPESLSKKLGCEVVIVDGRKKDSLDPLINIIETIFKKSENKSIPSV